MPSALLSAALDLSQDESKKIPLVIQVTSYGIILHTTKPEALLELFGDSIKVVSFDGESRGEDMTLYDKRGSDLGSYDVGPVVIMDPLIAPVSHTHKVDIDRLVREHNEGPDEELEEDDETRIEPESLDDISLDDISLDAAIDQLDQPQSPWRRLTPNPEERAMLNQIVEATAPSMGNTSTFTVSVRPREISWTGTAQINDDNSEAQF